jgi:hypothetical protein
LSFSPTDQPFLSLAAANPDFPRIRWGKAIRPQIIAMLLRDCLLFWGRATCYQKTGFRKNGGRQAMRLIAILLALTVCAANAAETISGIPRIVDGDTLTIGNTKIRLASIDAPESDQICPRCKSKKVDVRNRGA